MAARPITVILGRFSVGPTVFASPLRCPEIDIIHPAPL